MEINPKELSNNFGLRIREQAFTPAPPPQQPKPEGIAEYNKGMLLDVRA